jgi:hypothetical protein
MINKVWASVKLELGNHLSKWSQSLRSIRTIWCHVFLIMHCWLTWYLVTRFGATLGNIIYITNGAMVTAIFTNYIWSHNNYKEQSNAKPKVTIKNDQDEYGAAC